MRNEESLTEFCPVCGSSTVHSRILSGSVGKASIYRCSGCELTRLLPLPGDSEYQEVSIGMYKDLTQDFLTEKMNLARQSVAGYLGHLQQLGIRARSLVDLSGGLGYYSAAFAEKGIQVTYVDFDSVSVAFVREHFQHKGFKIEKSSVEDFCRNETERYDLIFYRHAIEHCRRPDEILRLMNRLSTGNTTIIVETDNNKGIELLFHPACRAYWRQIYSDHYNERSLWRLCRLRPLALDWSETHYYGFNLTNLSRLLTQTGWQVMNQFHYALGDPVYWPNMPAAKEYKFRRPGRDWRSWGSEMFYRGLFPLLKRWNLTSGLAIYANNRGLVS